MSAITLYHNPRCSKSRATLALLEENEVELDIVYYLENPPNAEELKALLEKLGLGLRDIIRKSEPEFEELGLGDQTLSDEIVLDLVCKHPRLIQRPIIVKGDRAVLGRPPENVFALIREA